MGVQANLLTKRQVAEHFGVSLGTLEKIVKRGELNFIRVGALLRFRPEDVEEYLKNNFRRPYHVA